MGGTPQSGAIYRYASKIKAEAAVDKPVNYQELFFYALLFIQDMIKLRKVELAEIPYELRTNGEDLYKAAFYADGMNGGTGLVRLFRGFMGRHYRLADVRRTAKSSG
jgi:hypothetical protein